jgi:hypothetical protein
MGALWTGKPGLGTWIVYKNDISTGALKGLPQEHLHFLTKCCHPQENRTEQKQS